MKPPKLHKDQAVTPNRRYYERKLEGNEPEPRFGEVYHVLGQDWFWIPGMFEGWYVELKEIPGVYVHEECLDPVELTSADIQELVETAEPIMI